MMQRTADPPETLEALLLSALEPAYNFALKLTWDAGEAEDLLQEAALRACRFFHQFEPGTNFRSWFLKILANCYFQDRRREGRRGEQVRVEDAPPLHLYLRSAELGLLPSDSDPAAALLAKLGNERVAAALADLPEEYRLVCTLYFIDDLQYEQIAEVLEIPLGTVRSRLHRGRRMLQKTLWDMAVEYGLVPREEND